MDLEFNKKKEIDKKTLETCNRLYFFLFNTEVNYKSVWVNGKSIAKHLKITPVKVRKYIQIIRENNNLFEPHYYIIASKQGYKLTRNKAEIKKFAKSIQTRATSALAQVDQAYKITKKGW